MIPKIIIQIALIIIIARSGYVAFHQLNHSRKNWLDILFHLSIAVVALEFLI